MTLLKMRNTAVKRPSMNRHRKHRPVAACDIRWWRFTYLPFLVGHIIKWFTACRYMMVDGVHLLSGRVRVKYGIATHHQSQRHEGVHHLSDPARVLSLSLAPFLQRATARALTAGNVIDCGQHLPKVNMVVRRRSPASSPASQLDQTKRAQLPQMVVRSKFRPQVRCDSVHGKLRVWVAIVCPDESTIFPLGLCLDFLTPFLVLSHSKALDRLLRVLHLSMSVK